MKFYLFNLYMYIENLKDLFRSLSNRGEPAGQLVCRCIGAFISTLSSCLAASAKPNPDSMRHQLFLRSNRHTRLHSHSVPLYLCYGDSGLCLTLIFCFPSKYGTPLRLNREFPFKRGPRKRKMLHRIKTILIHPVFSR